MMVKILALRNIILRSQRIRTFHAPSSARTITATEADKIVFEKFKEGNSDATSESDIKIAKNNARVFTLNWMLATFAFLGIGFLSYLKFGPHDTLKKSIKRHEQ